MFQEFAPTYFDYMVKVFFHNYPSALAKILGAFTIKTKNSANPDSERKVYLLLMENLNLGISEDDEQFITRYDLKGSELNRLVNPSLIVQPSLTLLDSNFLL
jgi:1-phosphatidylinositol-3-phosphate 5-kinase